MSEFPTSIGIMFPASWPKNDPDAHCTLLYLGDMADATFTKDDIQNVLKRLDFHAPGPVKTTGVEYFGPEKDIPVVTLSTQSLENYRETLERVLAKINVHNVSEFKDFKPHVTISYGPFEGSIDSLDIPETIVLGAPQLWWGDDPLTV